jgi:hypothetical protein
VLVCASDIVCCHDCDATFARDRDENFLHFLSPVFSHFVTPPRVDALGIIYDLYVRGDEPHVNGTLSNDRLFVLQTEGILRVLPTNAAEIFVNMSQRYFGLFSVRDARRIPGRRHMHRTAAAQKENEAPQMEALKYHRLRAHNAGARSPGNSRKNMRNSAIWRVRK